MSADTDGYLTDVEYTGDFYPHLAPAWLAYVARINGYRAPSLERFRYCELGCGQGITSLILAATHPAGEFHACDFNAAHIARAEDVRRAGRVDNVQLHASSFAQMLEADLPAFDFIALHGVYSWVPEPVRAEVREFIMRKLRPGGCVMVSYNAMPGWAHLLPIRRMLRAYAEGSPGDSLAKARAAFAEVDFLARHRAGYFAANPGAAEHVKSLATQDIRYVAHEYLTPHGDAFWFDEVAAALREAGVVFAGSMTAADNYRELMVPDSFRERMAAAASRADVEALRDVVANTAFRRDLFVAQPRAPARFTAGLEAFDGIAFALTDVPEALPLARSEGGLQYDLTGHARAIAAIHARLADGPATAREPLAASGAEDIAFLVEQLVVSGHLVPCPPASGPHGWLALDSALLDMAIRDRRQQVPLACPRTGLASDVEVVSAAAIEAAVRADDALSAGRHVLARLRAGGYPVNRLEASGARRPATDAEVVQHAAAVWRSLQDPANPDRRRLQLQGLL